jgi:hypothetical protein
VVQQAVHPRPAGELGEPVRERAAELLGAEPLEVHHQARGVVQAVQGTQVVVEL